jgi:hypothetical protein
VSDGVVRIPLLRRLRRDSAYVAIEEEAYGPVTIPAAAPRQGSLAEARLHAFFETGTLEVVDHGAFAEERREWVVSWTRMAPAA